MKRFTLIIMTAALLFAGCGSSGESTAGGQSAAEPTDFSYAPVTVTTGTTESAATDEVSLEDLAIDPPYSFNPDEMLPSDFGDYFKTQYNSVTSTYKLLAGDRYESEVTMIKSPVDGPSVYVIAGIHGDEEAAWQAGKLLKKISIKAGTLYIIAPANKYGAVSHSRLIDSKDPNRVWPGDKNGNGAEKVAASIFADVKEKSPDFVFDLHEARIISDDRDFLGSSLIYTTLDVFPDDLFMDIIDDAQNGIICNHKLNSYSPGPAGSVNRTITEKLGIPTFTVETFRGYQMEDRIHDQLDIVNWVLKCYGLE